MKKFSLFNFVPSVMFALIAAFFCGHIFAAGLATSEESYGTIFNTAFTGSFSLSLVAGLINYLLPGKATMKGSLFNLISGTPVTFVGDVAKKGILQPAFEAPDLKTMFTIVEGIKAKLQVIFMGNIEKVTRKSANCNNVSNTPAVPLSEKFWEPNEQVIWIEQCYGDLKQTFIVWGLAAGYEKPQLEKATMGDDSEGLWDEFAMSLLEKASSLDLFRVAWFADKTANTTANGGWLTSSGNIPNYDQATGMFKRIFDAVTATASYRYTIAQNTASTIAGQMQGLPSTFAYDIFTDLVENMDSRAQAQSDLMILVTQSVFNNWKRYRKSNAYNGQSWSSQANGVIEAEFDGIPIIPVPEWDRHIKADMRTPSTPATYYRPHRVVLAPKSILQLGYNMGEGQKFETYYEWKPQKVHMRGMYDLDTQLPNEFMLSAAY